MREKRVFLCLLAAGLIVNLVACGGSNENAADKSQDTSTPVVTQPVESSTSTPEQTTQTAPETTSVPESVSTSDQADTSEPKEAKSLFTETDETLYATTTVNVRSSYSTDSDKLGSLAKAQSVKRTGVGTGAAAGWSRIEFNGKVAYVSSDYLSATKPQVNTSTGSNSGSSSGQTSKPSTSTGGNTSGGGSSSGSNSLDDLGQALGGMSGVGTDHELSDEGKGALAGEIQLGGQAPASGGLGGLINADNGGDSDAFKDNQSEGNAGINVN